MKCIDQEKIFSRKKNMNVLRLLINAHRAIIDSARIRGRKTQEKEGAPTRPRTPCKLNSSHENKGARLG